MLHLHRLTVEELKPGANKDNYKLSHKVCEIWVKNELTSLNEIIGQATSPGLVAELRDLREPVREALNVLYATRLP